MSNPRIQLRHDTASNWSTANPVLLAGEVGIEGTINPENYNKVGDPTINSGILSNISNSNYIYINIFDDFDVCIKYKSSDNIGYNSLFALGIQNENTCIYTQNNGALFFYSNDPDISIDLNTTINTNTNYFIRIQRENNSTIFSTKVSTDSETLSEALADSSNWTSVTDSSYNYFSNKNYNIGFTPDANGWTWKGTVDLTNSKNNNTILYHEYLKYTKLKIGDGETAWNDLPYII